ncbi:unnamed protein product [Urochloa humidicola]
MNHHTSTSQQAPFFSRPPHQQRTIHHSTEDAPPPLQGAMKKPSTLLKSFSSRLSTRFAPSPAVAPWPPVRSAYDRWLAAELDELRADPLAPCTIAAWLALAAAAQWRLVASAPDETAAAAGIDRKAADECVDDTAELLDACAGVRDRLDMLRSYAAATRVALHWLEGGHGGDVAARRRTRQVRLKPPQARREGRRAPGRRRRRGALRRARRRAARHRRAGRGAGIPAAPRRVRRRGGAPRRRRQARGAVGVRDPGGAEARQGGVRAAEEGRRAVHGRARSHGGRRVGGEVRRRRRAAVPGDGYGGGEETVASFEEKVGDLHRELIAVRMVLLEGARRARGHELLRLPRI